MVHVFKPDPGDTSSYFFPVDGEGVIVGIHEKHLDTQRILQRQLVQA